MGCAEQRVLLADKYFQHTVGQPDWQQAFVLFGQQWRAEMGRAAAGLAHPDRHAMQAAAQRACGSFAVEQMVIASFSRRLAAILLAFEVSFCAQCCQMA